MKILKNIILLLSICIVTTCRKDPAVTTDCRDLPPSPLTGWNYVIDTPCYTLPYFNPNNPNEIIFQSKNYSTAISKLFKFNLATKQKTLIYSGENLFQPKWGKNDWILLNLYDANIWKIKSNGDSLTQLTNTQGDFAPEWNLTSDRFCFYRSIAAFQKMIIADDNGNILDTLNNFFTGQCCWQHPNLIVTTSGMFGLHTINPNSDVVEILLQQQEPTLESAIWSDNFTSIIYTAENGIFKMSYPTKKITCIKPSCFTKNYLFPSYSSQSNKLIFQRVDQKVINSSTVEVKSRLFMMNIDGTNEEEIIIH